MSFQEVKLNFEGAHATKVVFEVSDIDSIALVVETYDNSGELECHTFLDRKDAIKLANTILEICK